MANVGQGPILQRPTVPTFAEVTETVIELRAPTWTTDKSEQQGRFDSSVGSFCWRFSSRSNKHKTSTRKVFRRYKSTVLTEHGKRACLKVEKQQDNGKRPLVAQFGGIPLKRKRQAVLVDQQPERKRFERNELIKRFLANECGMCGSTVDVEVNHIRALRDLNVKGRREKPKWVHLMAARKRITLVVCRTCHMDIHHGRSTPHKQK